MSGKPGKTRMRVTWIKNLSAKNGQSWAYFSRSGKSLQIYARPHSATMDSDTVIVRLTLKQMLSGNKFLNKKVPHDR